MSGLWGVRKGSWSGFLEGAMFELSWKGCPWKKVGVRNRYAGVLCGLHGTLHSFLCSGINSTNTINLGDANSGVIWLGLPSPSVLFSKGRVPRSSFLQEREAGNRGLAILNRSQFTRDHLCTDLPSFVLFVMEQ